MAARFCAKAVREIYPENRDSCTQQASNGSQAGAPVGMSEDLWLPIIEQAVPVVPAVSQ